MKLSELTEEMLSDELIDRLLYPSEFDYGGQQADAVLVLGSRKACEYRVPMAVEIFSRCGAEKLILTGGKVQQTPRGCMSEFMSMLEAALELGIDCENILTESRSMTTEENFIFSKLLIPSHSSKIILVTTGYHMRRALLMARQLMPEFNVIPAAVQMGSAARHNWKLSQKGRNTAHEEALKLRYYAVNGKIEDIEI